MKIIHVECKLDELLISKLGFQRKFVIHHQGKSRVFHTFREMKYQLAVVDEDPGSVKTKYEKALQLIEESEDIKYFSDKLGNKVFILKGKLEDWIVNACKQQKIKPSTFGLPEKPNDLHDVINQKISNFEKLINELIAQRNPTILKLKAWLN